MTPEEQPPFLRTWPRVYTLVLLGLLVQVLLLLLFTRAFQ